MLPIEELEKICDIDNVKLGYWKHEGFATKAKFLRQKCYIEKINDNMKITCSGMPKTCYDYVDWENFKIGFTCPGKLTFNHVKGGVKLVETEFTIREPQLKKMVNDIEK